MRNFWGFYDNGTYRVGCNGGTVYVYDQDNKELAKFKDLKYAYEGAFQPGANIFVLKSTEGPLAVYDLDRLELLKKIVVTKIGAQDEGYAFSPDGELFYNIEKPVKSTRTQLTVYRTSDYTVSKVLFAEDHSIFLEEIEFEMTTGECFVFGFMRNTAGVMDYGFIGKLVKDQIMDIRKLERDEYDYIGAYKKWARTGCTEKKLQWSRLKNYEEKPQVTLKQVYDRR